MCNARAMARTTATLEALSSALFQMLSRRGPGPFRQLPSRVGLSDPSLSVVVRPDNDDLATRRASVPGMSASTFSDSSTSPG